MAVETKSVGRTLLIDGWIYLERWIQIDAGTLQIYGNGDGTGDTIKGDLSTLDDLTKTLTVQSGGTMWYGNPDPGATDTGESNSAWYGQVIWVPFHREQEPGRWYTLAADVRAFIDAAFPGELIQELGSNRRFEKPLPSGDLSDPARYVLWAIDFER